MNQLTNERTGLAQHQHSHLAILLLPQAGMHHTLEDVLLGCGWLQVADEVEGLRHLGMPQVVDDQVQARLRGDVAQLG